MTSAGQDGLLEPTTSQAIEGHAARFLGDLGHAFSTMVKNRAWELIDRSGSIAEDDARSAWLELVSAEDRRYSLSVYELARHVDYESPVSIQNRTLDYLCPARRQLQLLVLEKAAAVASAGGRSVVEWHDVVRGWHELIEGDTSRLDPDVLAESFRRAEAVL